MQNAAKSYFQTQVTTTTQGDLLIMLFDGALKFLHQAREKIIEKDYAKKGVLISKTIDILSELQGSLNAQKGGELADRLQKLYFYCNSRLAMANLKMDVDRIDEVVGILTGLREAFNEANAKVATKAVPVNSQSGPRLLPAAGGAPTATVATSSYALGAQAAGVPPRPAAAPMIPAAGPRTGKPQPAASHGLAPVRADDAAGRLSASEPLAAEDAQPEAGPCPTAFETVVTPTVAPVRRAMAAYAAGQGSAE